MSRCPALAAAFSGIELIHLQKYIKNKRKTELQTDPGDTPRGDQADRKVWIESKSIEGGYCETTTTEVVDMVTTGGAVAW